MSTELPIIIGLTGGIATGKSTVTNLFRNWGVQVIDADVIARKVVEPGSAALQEIETTFGKQTLQPDGSLNREALGQIVFQDPQARLQLNAITHMRIAEEMLNQARAARTNGNTWLIYDAALLFENHLQEAFELVVVVSASPDTQLQRLKNRDQLSDKDAADRVASQLPIQDKVAQADWVIDNNGHLDDTRAQVETLYHSLTQRFGDPQA